PRVLLRLALLDAPRAARAPAPGGLRRSGGLHGRLGRLPRGLERRVPPAEDVRQRRGLGRLSRRLPLRRSRPAPVPTRRPGALRGAPGETDRHVAGGTQTPWNFETVWSPLVRVIL